jgi:hypothetical protein
MTLLYFGVMLSLWHSDSAWLRQDFIQGIAMSMAEHHKHLTEFASIPLILYF